MAIKVTVLPMYMGVILHCLVIKTGAMGAPHVYGGDPFHPLQELPDDECSPCIWG